MSPSLRVSQSLRGTLTILLVAIALFSLAVNRHDFAGLYTTSDVTDLGNKVKVHVSMQVANFSDHDVKNAEFMLMGSQPADPPIGAFPAIREFKSSGDVIVHREFTVLKKEFEQWNQRGHGPRVVMFFKDSLGRAVRQEIEMSRRTTEVAMANR